MAFLFEVMGEEPSLTVVWILLVGTGIIGFFAAYLRWYLAIPALGMLTFIIVAMWQEFHEPDLYLQIQKEAPSYIPLAYVAMVISIILPVVGMVLNLKRKRNKI